MWQKLTRKQREEYMHQLWDLNSKIILNIYADYCVSHECDPEEFKEKYMSMLNYVFDDTMDKYADHIEGMRRQIKEANQ